ncbi:hypothetical protein [Candidatus Enterovibrio escicola]
MIFRRKRYPTFKELNRKVIKSSVDKLHHSSDLLIQYETRTTREVHRTCL